VSGVPADKFRPISSAVDKLDKLTWEDVRKEMIEEKGLDSEVADRIGEYVKHKGGRELLEYLFKDTQLSENAIAKQGLTDMVLLFDYLETFRVANKVSFDLSLARGLDYYTGIIYEAVLTNPLSDADEDSSTDVGSIAGGGRYDELVGMFSYSAGGKKSMNIPCVGFSIGVERIFSILLQKSKLEEIKSNECQVYVISVGDGLLKERMQICTELWDHSIKAEFMYKAKPKLQPQFNVCDKEHIPLAVIIGGDELKNGVVKIKDMRSKTQEQGGVQVPRESMIEEIKKRL